AVGRVVPSVVVVGGLVLSHPVCAYWWFAISVLVLGAALWDDSVRRRSTIVRRYIIVIAAGLPLSAFWWVGFLLNQGQLLHTEPFPDRPVVEIVQKLATLRDTGGPVMAALAVLGVIVLVR